MNHFERIALFLISITIVFGAVSCADNTQTQHTHTYETEWTYDDTYHWHKATCEHTAEISAKAEHIYDDGVVTLKATKTKPGIKTFTCTVCEKKTETKINPLGEKPDDTDKDKVDDDNDDTDDDDQNSDETDDTDETDKNDDDNTGEDEPFAGEKGWRNVESLKKVYVDSGIFDHIGLAVERKEIYKSTVSGYDETSYETVKDIAEGLKHHVNSITMGNEFKPQWFLWYYNGVPSHTKEFTSTAFDGYPAKTIKVPDNIPSTGDTAHGFGGVDTCLQYCKDNNIQMRGHVLTWHSQTFKWFFCEDYDEKKPLVGKEEMTARHEWYIKSVLEHVTKWEKDNNYKAIYTWDVVNEAVANDASKTVYLRGATPASLGKAPDAVPENGSFWYQIYESDEFIVNAFRFANKYAPDDVTLCYNDYNEYMDYGADSDTTHKRTGIIKVLQSVQSHQKDETLPTRIDAMAMQSHIEEWVGISGVEDSIKAFLDTGLDLQVTELDFKWNSSSKDNFAKPLEDIYSDYFKLYQKYAKSKDKTKPGITSVTIWGIEDANTWLNPADKSATYYPLLFTRDEDDNLVAKDTFFSVIDAAGK